MADSILKKTKKKKNKEKIMIGLLKLLSFSSSKLHVFSLRILSMYEDSWLTCTWNLLNPNASSFSAFFLHFFPLPFFFFDSQK